MAYSQLNSFRNHPSYSDFEEMQHSVPGITVFIKSIDCTAAMFLGNSKKYTWYHRFETDMEMMIFIDKKIKLIYDKNILKIKRKENEKIQAKIERDKVQIGDVYCTSWGYEQTNVDFFEVVAKPSPASVVVRGISKIVVPDSENHSSHRVKPDIGNYISNEEKKRIDTSGNISKIDNYDHKGYKTNATDSQYESWGY